MQMVMTGQQVTMSSREIAELTGKRHDNVMAICRSLSLTGVCPEIKETPYVNEQNGQTYLECRLSKRDSLVLIARLSPEFTAKIVDRWQELEAKQSKPAELSRMDILKIAMEAEQGRLEAEKKLAIAAPKAEFVDKYVASSQGSAGLREVCKILGAKQPEFVDFLIESGFMYRTGPKNPLTPKAEHIHNGRFEARTGTAEHGDNSHAYVQYKFTPKGVNWIAGEWGKNQVRELF